MHEEVLKKLKEPFNFKARKGQGGKTFYYVPSDDVVERMNEVFKGNWSTEVLSIKEKEGYVLAHVRVSALDQETGIMFKHEGFAGQYIARYTEGPRRGQVVDIGNSYKAAISKAIKVACSRWGVGLRLDPDLIDSEQPPVDGIPQSVQQSLGQQSPVQTVPNDIPQESTQPATTNVVTQTPDIPFFDNSPVVDKPAPEQQTPSQVDLPSVNLDPTTPVVDQTVSTPSEPQPKTSPATANAASQAANVLPDIPENVTDSLEIPQDVGPQKLTSVQETAISILMEQYNLSYDELAKKALGRDTFPPLSELEYKDAVKILQYGNNLK